MTLQGGEGGSAAVNSVFVDFSGNEQTSVIRKSWNFGFAAGSDFAVILNNTTGSTAVEAVKQDLAAVISDTESEEYANKLKLGQGDGGLNIIDDISGDLSKTVIKEGKVYIVNLGDNQTPLYKVKVTKKDTDTYTIEYAKSNESTVKSLDVKKDAAYNFIFASITENKVAAFEPAKSKWDIVYGRTTYKTTDKEGNVLPYIMSDFIRINKHGGVTASLVDGDKDVYQKFSAVDAAKVSFSSDVDVIGDKWRSVFNGIYDKFIVLKDAGGNIYKMRILKMGVNSDGGTRGYPEIEYALVK